MTCEWAEGYLSAYLDDALDPQLRKDVGAHIEQCAHCQALKEEYRRNDQLLATLTPVEPSDQLRQRIFESPAFAALARELERESADAPPGRAVSRRAPLVMRALVPLAALLTVSLGAALLFKQGLLPFGAQTASQKQTNTIGGPGSFNLPLSAGPRLVFLNGGALWSVAEYATNSSTGAPGTPQRLTATGAQVIAWRVSPLAGANYGGARIAYVDGMTGALHLVHSDGQADTIVGALSPTQSPSDAFWGSVAGRAALDSLTWSPDGSQLAYVAATSGGGAQAHVVSLTGASASFTPTSDAGITQLTWSADSHALAASTVNGGVSTVLVWRGGAGRAVATLPADPGDAQASVGQIAWSGSTLTWTTSRNGVITGVYALAAKSVAATRLTAASASYTAAAFTPAHGGVWLLASENALSEARLARGGVAQVATLGSRATSLVWSPDGEMAAVTLTDRLALWRESAGLSTLAQGAASQATWSPSGDALAVAQGQNVLVYSLSNGATTPVERLNGGSVVALAWAADGRNIAIAETQGMLLAPTNGSGATLLTSHQAADGALVWSVAR